MNRQPTQPHADRLRKFDADLTGGLGSVRAKFVEDALMGIYRAKSVILTDLADALNEVHATQKRLSRNLGHPGLGTSIADRLLTIAARRVRKDTLLVVHVRDPKNTTRAKCSTCFLLNCLLMCFRTPT